jgi:thiol-disulfide isomerase/thioredoxin
VFKTFLARLRRLNWKSILIQLLIVILVIGGVRMWQQRDAVSGTAPMIVDQSLKGTAIDLDDYRGKPVLVHFWATWCPVCRLENDSIDAIANDHAVISIASWSEGAEDVARFMAENQLSMPVIVDPDGAWASLYGVRAVPASYLIDGQGEIRFIETGYTTEAGLRLRLWWLENS